MKSAGGAVLAAVSLDPEAPLPLHQQLYEAVRAAIVAGQLRRGTRLPSTRSLAADLGVSRNTVLAAFDQLTAEGYLKAKTGSGTQVVEAIPDDLLSVRPRTRAPLMPAASRRSSTTASRPVVTPVRARAFEPGLPALDVFPAKLWARLVARQWARSSAASLGYGDPAGDRRLREALAHYAGAARGVVCDADQVIITSGTHDALELVARVLLDAGDVCWFEEPGYPFSAMLLRAAGARVIHVPVDGEGLNVAAARRRVPAPRLICATPSHQFPLGVTMSASRRLQLLELARRAHAWIFENDYDGEYRHANRPVPSIQSLDAHGRVFYAGTFSKVLFPALRLGYLVVPPAVVERFLRARALAGRPSPTTDQSVLADFIIDGHFARHIRRMRAVYRERHEALLAAAAKHLDGLLTVQPPEGGTHAVGWLHGIDDVAASNAAAEAAIDAAPLSAYCSTRRMPDALLLGYGIVTPRQIFAGAATLARALEPLTRSPRSQRQSTTRNGATASPRPRR